MSNQEQQMEKQLQEAYDTQKKDMLCLLSQEEIVLFTKQAKVSDWLCTCLGLGFIVFAGLTLIFMMSFLSEDTGINFVKLFSAGVCGGLFVAFFSKGTEVERKGQHALEALSHKTSLTPEENENLKILVGLLLKHPHCSSSIVSLLTELSSFLKENEGHRKFWNTVRPHLENLKKHWDKKWFLEDNAVVTISHEPKECTPRSAIYHRMLI